MNTTTLTEKLPGASLRNQTQPECTQGPALGAQGGVWDETDALGSSSFSPPFPPITALCCQTALLEALRLVSIWRTFRARAQLRITCPECLGKRKIPFHLPLRWQANYCKESGVQRGKSIIGKQKQKGCGYPVTESQKVLRQLGCLYYSWALGKALHHLPHGPHCNSCHSLTLLNRKQFPWFTELGHSIKRKN